MSKFEELMKSKSDEDLEKYIIDIIKYTPEAIKAAIAELQQRGRNFSETELSDIDSAIAEKEAEKEEAEKQSVNIWKKNQVTDPDAPLYYSKQAIFGFSTFFGVIFGAVLLSLNLKENSKAKWLVIGFGVLYTAFQITALNHFEDVSSLRLVFNLIGGSVLYTFFWDRFVGKTTLYRVKPAWKPLIISVVIMIPFIAAMLYEL
jgi:hypothetical protein